MEIVPIESAYPGFGELVVSMIVYDVQLNFDLSSSVSFSTVLL